MTDKDKCKENTHIDGAKWTYDLEVSTLDYKCNIVYTITHVYISFSPSTIYL